VKLLIITHRIPYPLTEGGKISQFALIDYLRNKCSITILIFAETASDYDAISYLMKIWDNVAFEVISLKNPVVSIKKTLPQNIFHFITNNINHVKYRVNKLIFKNTSAILTKDYFVKDKINYLVSFTTPREQLIVDQVSDAIVRIDPEMVQIDFIEVLDLALCVPDRIPKVFVHHEIRYLRIASEINAAGSKLKKCGKYLVQFCEMVELNLLKKVDNIVAFTEEDKALLQQKLPGLNVNSSPFPVLDKDIVAIIDENLIVNKLVFVGLENHSPNRDAVEWYMDSMSKMVYEKYGLVLHVIGLWSEKFKNKYINEPAIHFASFVEDLGKYCTNSIMLVPVRIGGGIRTKILYAMASGVPVISTTVGNAGIVDNDKNCIIANTSTEFVDAIGKLIEDSALRKMLVLNAQAIVRTHYSQREAGEKRFSFYKSMLVNKDSTM
jgi:glycosyltransferase involved in cell wall biosynthesis